MIRGSIFCGFLFLFSITIRAAEGMGGMAATIHPLATRAAIETLQKGGNAIDATVAAALTLGVVDSHNSGIGGGCFMVIHLADGRNVALDGREEAPGAATKNMFVKDGALIPEASVTGPLASGVPGSLAVYEHALKNFGKLSLRALILPAADLAAHGFPIDGAYAGRLQATAEDLARFPASRAIFLKADGQAYRKGETLKQNDLATSYRSIAEEGSGWFYRGSFAQKTAGWMKEHGGVLTAQDFASYSIKNREPLQSKYRQYTIIGFPPPSSGGVHVAQILNILEQYDLTHFKRGSAPMIHLVSEAMKLAFADRAYWLGDPDFTPVPRGLMSKDYASALARKIDLGKTMDVKEHGVPPNAATDVFGKHTTHFSVADAAGNWVACTATINTSFGSKVVIPGTGILLNNQMDDFATQPGTPNAFGLIGLGDANAIAPRKRPLSSMSPTIVLEKGRPIMSVGAAGGPTIISQTVLAIINHLDYHMSLEDSLKAPRFHEQWAPDELRIERQAGTEVFGALEKLGHKLKKVEAIGASQAVAVGATPGTFVGTAEPRSEGSALAVSQY